MTARYHLHNRVDYVGFISPNALVSKAIDGSAALLLPLGDNMESRYFTSPMKLVEYMATTIPVVAVDYPTVQGLAGNDTVYLAPNDPVQFAEAIQYAIEDPDQSERIGRMNARAEQYTHQARAQQYHTFLSEL
jgi:glycosyltransferase involved in cell wall biosynthesis